MMPVTIQKRILNKLQGYILDTELSSNPELNDMDYDNIINTDELELFYAQAELQCLSYCYLVDTPTIHKTDNTGAVLDVINPQFEEAQILWCAGLIWRKYDIRANDQVEETGFVVSYGDQLISDAKKELTPWRHQIYGCW